MNWKKILGIIGLIIPMLLITGWVFSPRITGFNPNQPLHGRQPIQITFSRSMDAESVERHLSIQPGQEGDFQWNESQKSLTFTPRDAWPSDRSLSVRISAGPRSTQRLPLLNPKTWQFEISPYLLTYLYPADGKSNIYSMNVESGENQPLTEHPGGVLDYDVSPDGLTLYYSRGREDGSSGLFALDRQSGEIQEILTCPEALCRNPQVSLGGDLIAYQRIPQNPQNNPGIYLLEITSQDTEPLLETGHHLENPSWSPQGWLAFYNRSERAYQFIHLPDKEMVTFPNDTGGQGTWAPDGVNFVTTEILDINESLAPRHLFRYQIPNGSKTDLTNDRFWEDATPSYSPEGRLAFGRKSLLREKWSLGRQLWILEKGGGEAYPVTNAGDYHHTAFAWHPDGDQMAYVRYNQARLTEAPEIWLLNLTQSQNARLIINAFNPQWIP
ncbi:MAG: PD40 domain-containing protein [Anaerolineales bacterium]|nr:PD40 domain-containing protein [Anaerolineales bacterium]